MHFRHALFEPLRGRRSAFSPMPSADIFTIGKAHNSELVSRANSHPPTIFHLFSRVSTPAGIPQWQVLSHGRRSSFRCFFVGQSWRTPLRSAYDRAWLIIGGFFLFALSFVKKCVVGAKNEFYYSDGFRIKVDIRKLYFLRSFTVIFAQIVPWVAFDFGVHF